MRWRCMRSSLKYGTCYHRATELTEQIQRSTTNATIRATSSQSSTSCTGSLLNLTRNAPSGHTVAHFTIPVCQKPSAAARAVFSTSPARTKRTHCGSQSSQGRSCRTVNASHGRASYPGCETPRHASQHVPSGPGVVPGLRDSTHGHPGGERRVAPHSHRATIWADGPGAERLALTLP